MAETRVGRATPSGRAMWTAEMEGGLVQAEGIEGLRTFGGGLLLHLRDDATNLLS